MGTATSAEHLLYQSAITREIIGSFFKVYDTLGFGFLEAVYRRAMLHELRKRRVQVHEEVGIDVWYDQTRIGLFALIC